MKIEKDEVIALIRNNMSREIDKRSSFAKEERFTSPGMPKMNLIHTIKLCDARIAAYERAINLINIHFKNPKEDSQC